MGVRDQRIAATPATALQSTPAAPQRTESATQAGANHAAAIDESAVGTAQPPERSSANGMHAAPRARGIVEDAQVSNATGRGSRGEKAPANTGLARAAERIASAAERGAPQVPPVRWVLDGTSPTALRETEAQNTAARDSAPVLQTASGASQSLLANKGTNRIPERSIAPLEGDASLDADEAANSAALPVPREARTATRVEATAARAAADAATATASAGPGPERSEHAAAVQGLHDTVHRHAGNARAEATAQQALHAGPAANTMGAETSAAGALLPAATPGVDAAMQREARPGSAFEPAAPGVTATTALHGHAPARAESASPAPASLPPALQAFVASAGPGLGTNLGQRILWLAGSRLHAAEIQLDPPELGPLQVHVQTHRDGASVQFLTHTHAAREAVEASLPRLREMLESSGMNLLDVNVAHHHERGGRGGMSAWNAAGSEGNGTRLREVEQLAATAKGRTRPPQGLVDDYA